MTTTKKQFSYRVGLSATSIILLFNVLIAKRVFTKVVGRLRACNQAAAISGLVTTARSENQVQSNPKVQSNLNQVSLMPNRNLLHQIRKP
jgi:hypothetical protein